MEHLCHMVTARAPANMAVIKYWGKRNEELILPLSDSLSATLSKQQMGAETTVAVNPSFTEDKIWLNGKEQTMENPRIKNCLQAIKQLAHDQKSVPEEFLKCKIHICSQNNFPTAAGFASSAAGYACLVFALGKLYCIGGDLSSLARLGSGSACRSMYGGFVQWHMGEKNDGADSFSTVVVPKEHWPEIRILAIVVSDVKKETSSTLGMRQSVLTSKFLKYRTSSIVSRLMKEMIQAIQEKDFHTFAEITMKDSNQFHAVCQDTYPPIRYMNDTSWAIVNLIHEINTFSEENKVAYTFDAGANACLYLKECNVPMVAALIKHYFPPLHENQEYFTGLPISVTEPSQSFIEKNSRLTPKPGTVQYIIHTQVGSGPKIIEDPSRHLLDRNGLPKSL